MDYGKTRKRSKTFFAFLGYNLLRMLYKRKDWIEQPIVRAPTKLKPTTPSCWDHFHGKARQGLVYAMGKITFKKNVPSSVFSGIACRSKVASK